MLKIPTFLLVMFFFAETIKPLKMSKIYAPFVVPPNADSEKSLLFFEISISVCRPQTNWPTRFSGWVNPRFVHSTCLSLPYVPNSQLLRKQLTLNSCIDPQQPTPRMRGLKNEVVREGFDGFFAYFSALWACLSDFCLELAFTNLLKIKVSFLQQSFCLFFSIKDLRLEAWPNMFFT